MTAQTEWYDNDTLWEVSRPFMLNEKFWTSAPAEIDQVTALLSLQPGSTVLDLCCGPGRHSLELARRGHKVTGVDRTGTYLDEARTRAAAESLHIELVKQEMKTFCRLDSFDAAILMFTSFGYHEDREDDRRVLLNVCASLKPGGRFIVDIVGKENLARMFRSRDWSEIDGTIRLDERTVVDDWSRLKNRWIYLKGEQRHEFEFGLNLYSASELKAMMLAAGFSKAQVYGSLDGKPYDHEAKRLIVVATK
jgi:SAM-dependent methyltransferase